MDVKPESWQLQPNPHSQARHDNTTRLARRRSGDENCLAGIVVQRDRPFYAARPHSCIEGRLTDKWLQTLEALQTHPVPQQVPPFVDRAISMPDLPHKVVPGSQNSLANPFLQMKKKIPCRSPSLANCALGNFAFEPVSRERSQIWTGPSTQRAKLCCLAPVRTGWLPLQRHVVRKEDSDSAANYGAACKIKLKPPITPVLSCSSVKSKGSDLGEWASGVWRTAGTEKMPEASFLQTDVQRNHTEVYKQATSEQTSNSSHWHTPVQRRESIPQLSPLRAPSTGSDPKYSSSISSITITSKKVSRSSSLPDTSRPAWAGLNSPIALNNHNINTSFSSSQYLWKIPKRKAIAVKITEQRDETRSFLQPNDKNGSAWSRSTEGSSRFFTLPTRRRHDLLHSTENHTLQTGRDIPDIPKIISKQRHLQSTTQDQPYQSAELRRKATIIKVMEHRESYSRPIKEDVKRLNYRHSYTEGLNDTNSVTYQQNPSYTNPKPMTTTQSELDLRSLHVAEPIKKASEHYKSTMSLILKEPSSNNFSLDNYHCNNRPRRPSSCYASLFIPAELSNNASEEPEIQSTSSAPPHETNIDPSSFTGSSSNRCLSLDGGAGSSEKIYQGRASYVPDVGHNERGSVLQRNQPLTLIKVPESSTHETHDAIVSLNAAAVIANIKLQSQQRKKSLSHGTPEETDSASQSKTAKARADKSHMAEQDAAASLSISTETAACMKLWHVPLEITDYLLPPSETLSKALEHQRPDFIRRSQARVRAVEQRARERQQLLHTHQTTLPTTSAQKQRDNISSSHNHGISRKQKSQQIRRNYSNLPEVKKMKEEERRKKEEEKRKLALKTNRLRAEIFKKKVLDQVLKRGKN